MFNETRRNTKRLLGLTCALELGTNSDELKYDFMLNTAKQLQAALGNNHVPLTTAEKVRIVKSITRAKVVAYRKGASDDYRTFRALNLISTDLVKML